MSPDGYRVEFHLTIKNKLYTNETEQITSNNENDPADGHAAFSCLFNKLWK